MSERSDGWYPDPQDPSVYRFWDGEAWGEQTRPRAPQTKVGWQVHPDTGEYAFHDGEGWLDIPAPPQPTLVEPEHEGVDEPSRPFPEEVTVGPEQSEQGAGSVGMTNEQGDETPETTVVPGHGQVVVAAPPYLVLPPPVTAPIALAAPAPSVDSELEPATVTSSRQGHRGTGRSKWPWLVLALLIGVGALGVGVWIRGGLSFHWFGRCGDRGP